MVFTKRILLGLIICVWTPLQTMAQQGGDKGRIEALQTEMYRLFYQEDSLQFRKVVNELKAECEKAGDEEVFYKAWGNYAIYESTHQRRTQAQALAKEMADYAEQHNSIFGQYTAMHVLGTVYHQMRDYDNAEKTFKAAIDFLHKNSPEKSAAADYIELVLISVNGRSNVRQGMVYAEKVLQEPNVSAQHRMRVLTMLCQLEGEKANPDKDVFNRYYEERLQARAGTPPDRAEAAVNMLYYFVNGDLEHALVYSDSLSSKDQITYAKARIYHKMGDESRAYQQMLAYKSVKDSMNLAERTGLLSDYILQLNNERLEREKDDLKQQNAMLVTVILFILGALFVAVLVWVIWRRVKLTRKLQQDNVLLGEANKREQQARMVEHEERRKAERELDVKREFLNSIAKELRSPLNPITGFSDILADESIELQPEEREMMSQHIKESSHALTGIIDNMIELSYYESKGSLSKNEVFSPELVCQNAIDFIHETMAKPGVEVNFRSILEKDVMIKSDMQAVGKVLRQLLNNAVKFTDAGNVLLTCQEVDGCIRFMVADTGCGVDPEWRKYIFEPLKTDGLSAHSSGMGLAICSTIAKLLGGRIWLDESYKKGSRFIFELPKE